MKAVYEALCKHGYADLTIQRIGDEFSKITKVSAFNKMADVSQ